MPLVVEFVSVPESAWQACAQALAKSHVQIVSCDWTAFQKNQKHLSHVAVFGCAAIGCLEAVERIAAYRKQYPQIRCILLADRSSEAFAIEALRAGVFDYFPVPFDAARVVQAIFRAMPSGNPAAASRLPSHAAIVGVSAAIRRVQALIERVASVDCNVLVTGETGTGKELISESIHRASQRAAKPFSCVNCAAIPDALLESELFGYERGAFTGAVKPSEGKLKSADGGTVLLDEIGDMSPMAQAKVLRVIERKELQRLGSNAACPVDVRIIAATHRDLEKMAGEERFRSDLFFRLNIARIHLPPLRERRDDIPLLVAQAISQMRHVFGQRIEGLSIGALELIQRYDWPGNVRELRNVIESLFVFAKGPVITTDDIAGLQSCRLAQTAADASGQTAHNEKSRILDALLETSWNMTKAAEKLHVSRMTIYRRAAKYGIVRETMRNTKVSRAAG